MLIRFLAPVIALAGYGGWSAWLNIAAANPAWLRAGVSHGLYAFVFTWIFRMLTEKLLKIFSGSRLARFNTFVIMAVVIVTLPVVSQWLAGNAAIGLTILPGVVVGLFYLVWLLFFESETTKPKPM